MPHHDHDVSHGAKHLQEEEGSYDKEHYQEDHAQLTSQVVRTIVVLKSDIDESKQNK
jgi:hypothetical protein